MSRTLALALSLLLATAATAQRAPQLDLGAGVSTVDRAFGPAATATLTAWPSRVGVVVHGEYSEQIRLLDSSPRSAASIGVLAALAVPVGQSEITLAAGPSIGYEQRRPSTLVPARGWTPGATARVQVAVPVSPTLGLALGVSGTASANGLRPASTLGLAVRLGD